jgi:hypothetical protein
MRPGLMTLTVLMLLAPAMPASAEWQLKPFAALTFGGNATVLDLDKAAGKVKTAVGVSGGYWGNVVGVEGDFGYIPGFFQNEIKGTTPLVLKSHVTTLTGNVTLSLPRHMTEYTLRPYFVAGGGMMSASTTNSLSLVEISPTYAAIDVGGGVTGFLSKRFGLSWDIRHFRIVNGQEGTGQSFGREQLSFWRANMALAIRY